MLKALSFLGTGKYTETTYVKHDRTACCRTDLFPKAVVELYQPEQLIAFVTPKVKSDKKTELSQLEKTLCGKFRSKDIPNGNSTAELWEIFKACEEVVDPGDEIILDITHAFRSIPLLVFIAASYLRQVKQVELKHIIYGAFDPDNPDSSDIFDLTPFVDLLNWTNAVNVFQLTGDARPIANLDIHPSIKDALTKLSESLLTNRTIEVQEAAFAFNGLFSSSSIPKLVTASSVGSQAPFQMLIDQLRENYSGMAVNNPRNNPKQSIKKQYEQIKWYIDNQHYLQAITLIREWLISWCYLDWRGGGGGSDWLRWHGHRNPVQDAFNHKPSDAPAPGSDALDLWTSCADLRNDLAHCGMQITPPPILAVHAIRWIKDLFAELEKFAKSKGVIP